VCMIRWRPDLWQFRRFLGLFLWNLGLPAGSDILAGPEGASDTDTPTKGLASDGYPVRMQVARDDGQALADVLPLAARCVEYCSDNMTFHAWAGWREVATPEGRLGANVVAGRGPLLVGLQVHSPGPRKAMRTLGGLPNPALQTVLRLAGEGNVRLWVNGHQVGSYTLAAGEVTRVPDIDLEAGANPVLLSWEPASPSSTLGLVFEDRDRQPEITFAFS
jgi:hypothetical protein